MANESDSPEYMTAESKERYQVAKINDEINAARVANDNLRAQMLVEHMAKETRRLDEKYKQPGTAWMNKMEYHFPDGHYETIPAGRYNVSEYLGLSMRASNRYAEAMRKSLLR